MPQKVTQDLIANMDTEAVAAMAGIHDTDGSMIYWLLLLPYYLIAYWTFPLAAYFGIQYYLSGAPFGDSMSPLMRTVIFYERSVSASFMITYVAFRYIHHTNTILQARFTRSVWMAPFFMPTSPPRPRFTGIFSAKVNLRRSELIQTGLLSQYALWFVVAYLGVANSLCEDCKDTHPLAVGIVFFLSYSGGQYLLMRPLGFLIRMDEEKLQEMNGMAKKDEDVMKDKGL